jgi:hypothetical protein
MTGGYTYDVPGLGIRFEADRLRRERGELIGELTVRCNLPGALQANGALSVGDLNFSSVQARSTRAKLLTSRVKTQDDVDWHGLVEEFAQKCIQSERDGEPAQDIWSIAPPEKVDDFSIDGIALPRKHPAILFGDGGSAKSYTALYIAGKLALQGVPVALFDWELSGDEHRERFEMMFAGQRPPLTYCRCDQAITSETDRIARIVKDNKIRYAVFDSISFAVSGPPEAAETAGAYFRAVRRLDIGSLHIAHVNKGEDGDKKPFGSAFWFNGARSIWYVKAAESGTGRLELGFFHRKSNLGPLRHPVALTLRFQAGHTLFERASISDTPEFAEKLSVRQKMVELLRISPLTIADIAERLEEKADTVRKTVKRSHQFVVISGGTGEQDRIGLRAKAL